MSTPELVMFAVVLLVGFPAAWRNLTAGALVGAYLLVQGAWAMGVVLDYGMMFMVDFTVVVVIFAKAIMRCEDEKLLNCGAHTTTADRFILAIFGLMWFVYVLKVDEFQRWWLLYLFATAQFLIAGAESLFEWRRARVLQAGPDSPSSGSYRVALAGASWGNG